MPHPPMTCRLIQLALLITVGAVSVTASSGDAYASGYALSEQGPTSSALGNAVTARADLPEAGFFNPAAYALRSSASLSVAILFPTITHSFENTTTNAEIGVTPVPQLHAGANFGDFGASLSVNVPFGSGVAWSEEWAGRYESTGSSLQVIEFGANASYFILNTVALSAGARLQSSQFGTSRQIGTARSGQDASVSIDGADVAVGGQVSALVFLGQSLTLGVNYRSHTVHDAAGVADFRNVPIELESRAHDTLANTTLIMPARTTIGAAYRFGPGTASLDMEYLGWGRVESVVVDFDDESMDDVVSPRNWSNALAFRLGYEHRLLNNALALRGGFSYDMSPAPDETIGASSPDGDRLGVHAGAGYTLWRGLRLDLSLGYMSIAERDVVSPNHLPGTYGGQIISTSFGVSWQGASSAP